MRVAVRATPGARRSTVGGAWRSPDGLLRLVVKAAAPAEKGRANDELVRALAAAFGVPASAVSIAAGEKDRQKTIEIIGDEAALKIRLDELLRGTNR